MYDLNKIVNNNKLEDVISQYVDLKKDGNEYRGLCPFHKEKTPSFTVVPEKGYYHCHGCGEHGGVIDFIKTIKGVNLHEACKILNGEKMVEGQVPQAPAIKEAVDIYAGLSPTGDRINFVVGERSGSIYNPKTGKNITLIPNAIYEYSDKEGKFVGYVVRIYNGEGKKIPLTVQVVDNGKRKSPCLFPFAEPRPLYGFDSLQDKGTIYIVEGEKSLDALRNILGKNVISWPMGTKAVNRADWDSLPKNREYILIPDADYRKDIKTDEVLPRENQEGYKAMKQVESLLPSPAKVTIVDTHFMGKVKEGWDVADKDFTKDSFMEWLDKAMGIEPEKTVEIMVKERNNKVSYDDTYFKCLGFYGMKYFFYHKPTGQVVGFAAREMGKSNMITLAPLDWWESKWPKGKHGADWDLILDIHLRIQEKVGIFDTECIRGRGAWTDEGRAVLHLGDKIIVDGVEMQPEDMDSVFIYKKATPLSLDYGAFLPVEESKKLVYMLKLARWQDESYGELLAGWIFASLVCGVMPFRSNIYLTGESGSGKSWIMEDVVIPLMGKIAVDCASTTSESGIRKYLNGDVRPIIFNEAEAEEQTDAKRMQAVFSLARNASDEKSSKILKGSGDGESFICRSSFIFASINKSTDKTADENRMLFLELAGSPKNVSAEEKIKDNDNFRKLEKTCAELINKEFVGSLLTRAVNLIPVMRKNHDIFANLGARITGCMRTGKTLAMPLCGLYGLVSDDVITEDMAIKYLSRYKKETDKAKSVETQEVQCLDKLLFTEIMCEDKGDFKRSLQISEVIYMLNHPHNIDGWDKGKLDKAMKSRGIMVRDGFVWLAGKKDGTPAKCYNNTQFASSWKQAIMRIEGVEVFKTTHFCSTLKTTGIKIPIDVIIESDKLI